MWVCELSPGAVSLGCVWVIHLPVADTCSQVAAVTSAASCRLTAGVAASSIGEGAGGV